jgi:UDP-N-acetyl-D-galactosamine dehydrogenase
VLVLGFTFKENISDIRNSRVADLVFELQSYGIKKITIFDPRANGLMVEKNYGLKLANDFRNQHYDVVVLAVGHNEFMHFTEKELKSFLHPPYIFFDLRSIYYALRNSFYYWSL